VRARRLLLDGPNSLPNGTRVGIRFSGKRVFVNQRNGFAIGTPPGDFGATYPIATVNGGKTWRTAGPILHIPAAQGAVAVNEAGMSGQHVWYAWGDGITVVDVTPDAGKHWWQAFLPGRVLTVYADLMCGRLTADVQPYTMRPNPPLWTYVSVRGRSWTYAPNPSPTLNC
jgi:hypothetical protein